ncbi:hypothetical protein [Mesorhizobium sp.]|uniref:hypothetical protein n=1 Tax=Mesorhizobium sp. TaxID=1871066 RepID=UPI000FE83DCD|nr:hypothetical protein [Mesorhizobium sp.]RWB50731.1 MAG: hypothetical protein EOQ47_32325 [Mesorhizobium sp.]
MATVPKNRDIANAWISYILGELYSEWPRRLDFNAMDVGKATGTEARWEDETLFDDMIRWLQNNGYILVGQEGDDWSVYGVELTEKGYLLLGSKPESLSEPLGDKMKEAAKVGAAEAGKSVVSNLVGMLMTAGVAYLKG